MLYLGAHMSISDGIINAKLGMEKIGGNCMQIFTGSPQSLNLGKVFELDSSEKIIIKKELKNFPTFIHSKYLLNFAKPLIPKNKIYLVRYVQDLNFSHETGMKGVVLHFGTSSNGISRQIARNNMAKSLISCLDHANKNTIPILETSSGEGNYLGRTIETMNIILRKLPTKYQKRIKFCIDTCHIFVSGYPIHKFGGWKAYIRQFEEIIGKNKIAVIHLNDSATPFNEKNDRHSAIGEGYIFNEKMGGSMDALQEILEWGQKHSIPCILETHGDYKPQISLCKKILLKNKKIQKAGKHKTEGIINEFRQLMDFHKALGNIHQFQVYKNIINKLSQLDEININKVKKLEGFGKGTIEKMEEFNATGKIKILEEMKQNKKLVALVNLQKIYGIGPKFAQQLIQKGYRTVEEIRKAHNSGKLHLNKQQIIGLKYFNDLNTRITKKDAKNIVNQIKNKFGKRKVMLMGGFRLGKKDGKDLDLIIVNPNKNEINNNEEIMALLGENIVEVLESGKGMMTLLMKFPEYERIVHVDIRMVKPEEEAFYVLYFGSGENFSRKIREVAKKMGYILNEHGLQKNGKYIKNKFKNEKEIFEFLNIDYVKPVDRL